MRTRTSYRIHRDHLAVSEIIGTILVLALTVTIMSGLMLMAQDLSTFPDEEFHVIFRSEMHVVDFDRNGEWDPGDYATINITHMGGDELADLDTRVQVWIDSDGHTFRLSESDLDIGDTWEGGETWSTEFDGYRLAIRDHSRDITNMSRVTVVVTDRPTQAVILDRVLNTGQVGSQDPIIEFAWVESVSGNKITQVVQTETNFSIAALIYDPDDNIQRDGGIPVLEPSIYVDLTPIGGDAKEPLRDIDWDTMYRTRGDLSVPDTIPQGNYQLEVHAVDLMGNSDVETFDLNIVLPVHGATPTISAWVQPNPVFRNGDFTVFVNVNDFDNNIETVSIDLFEINPSWYPCYLEDAQERLNVDLFNNGLYGKNLSLEDVSVEPQAYNIHASVSDTRGNSANITITMNVSQYHLPEILTKSLTPTIPFVGERLYINATVIDWDSDLAHVYANISSLFPTIQPPVELTDLGGDLFSYYSDPLPSIPIGTYTINFTAVDELGHSVSDSISIQVNDQFAPRITHLGHNPNLVFTFSEFYIYLSVEDPDGDLDPANGLGSVFFDPLFGATHIDSGAPNLLQDDLQHYHAVGFSDSAEEVVNYMVKVIDDKGNTVWGTINITVFTFGEGVTQQYGGSWTNTLSNITFGASMPDGDYGFALFNDTGLPSQTDPGGSPTMFFEAGENITVVVRTTVLKPGLLKNMFILFNPSPTCSGPYTPYMNEQTNTTGAFKGLKEGPFFEYKYTFSSPDPAAVCNKQKFSFAIHLQDNEGHEFQIGNYQGDSLNNPFFTVGSPGLSVPPAVSFWYDINGDGVISTVVDQPWNQVDWVNALPTSGSPGVNANEKLYILIQVNSAENPTTAVEVGNIEIQDFGGASHLSGTAGTYPIGDVQYWDDTHYIISVDLNGYNGKPWFPSTNYYILSINSLSDLTNDDYEHEGGLGDLLKVTAPARSLDIIGAMGYSDDHSRLSWFSKGSYWYDNMISEGIRGNITAMSSADIDNDGDNDVIIGTDDQVHASLIWFENRQLSAELTLGYFWFPHIIYEQETNLGAVTALSVGDLDFDGDGDVVASYNLEGAINTGVFSFENIGGGIWEREVVVPVLWNESLSPLDRNPADNTTGVIANITTIDNAYYPVSSGADLDSIGEVMFIENFTAGYTLDPGFQLHNMWLKMRYRTSSVYTGSNGLQVWSPTWSNWVDCGITPVQTSSIGTQATSLDLSSAAFGIDETNYASMKVRFINDASGAGEVVEIDKLWLTITQTKTGLTDPTLDLRIADVIPEPAGLPPSADLVLVNSSSDILIFQNRLKDLGVWLHAETIAAPGTGTEPARLEVAPWSVSRANHLPPLLDIFISDGDSIYRFPAKTNPGLGGPYFLSPIDLEPGNNITFPISSFAVTLNLSTDFNSDNLADIVIGTRLTGAGPYDSPVWLGVSTDGFSLNWSRVASPDLLERANAYGPGVRVSDVEVGDTDFDGDADIAVSTTFLSVNLYHYTNNKDMPEGPGTPEWRFLEAIVAFSTFNQQENLIFAIEMGYVDDA